MLAGTAVIPTQVAKPLALMLVFAGSDVVQVAFRVRLVSVVPARQAIVPPPLPWLLYRAKLPVAVNWTVSLVEP
jgi:hypothetical protein